MNEQPWLKHYDKGVPSHLEYPQVPLFHFLEESARKYPSSACTIFKGARMQDLINSCLPSERPDVEIGKEPG